MINAVKRYLDINYYSNQKKAFEELFRSHPNYPSVFAITDSLDMLLIENVAVKVPKEELLELPDSFLAIYKDNLALVTKTADSIIIISEEEEKQTISLSEFSEGWDGIVIAIEPNETIEKETFKINSNWIKYSLPALALLIISIAVNPYRWIDLALLATSVLGVALSVFIVQEKLGFKNQIVSKLCNMNANTSCDSVIQSDKSEINSWLSFADLPLLFFSINAIAILMQPLVSSYLAAFFSLISLPVIAYSVWLQKFQLKKWCLLCLAISFLIVFQSMGWFFFEKPALSGLLQNAFPYLFASIVISAIWILGLKPILENKTKAENTLNELKKFKRNYSLFNFLTKEIAIKEGFNQLEGVHYGNKKANVALTLILSPSCGHCYKVFQDAFELVSKFPERISLSILFNINPENNDNPYKIVAESMLAIGNSNPEKAEEALSDWYIKKMKLAPWLEKWKMKNTDMKVNYQIHQQYQWCLENEFNYTPVKIINERLFPNEYEISELKYYLNDLSEEKTVHKETDLAQI